MANKVDISEVKDLQNDLEEASTNFRSQLDQVKESIEAINSMSSFSGKAAKEAKQYFSELHLTILESFRGLFDDLEANLEEHLEAFRSGVDVSETAVIRSNYLQDVQEDVNELYEDLVKQDEIIHDTIQEVSDISSATPPSFSDVSDYKTKVIKKLKEVDEDLTSFTSTGDETDVQAIMSQIEAVMSNAQTSKGKARFADFEGASQGSDLGKLQAYSHEKKEERSTAVSRMDEENIDEMSMSEIEKAKDTELSDLEDGAGDILNTAYDDLRDGEIDRQTYANVLNGLKNFDKEYKEGKGDFEVSEELMNYIGGKENKNDVVDNTGEVISDGISAAPLFVAYGLSNQGFKIKKEQTKGKKMVRYRVHNPQVGGMSKPTKRDTKIYYKKYIDQQVKRGSGNKVPIANKVNVRAGATNGLKTKAGWVGVAIDSGLNIKDNIEDGESVQRIVGDAGVDVGVGAVSLAAAGSAAAFTVGTLGAPILAGAAAGFVISSGVSAVAGIEIGGKSVKDHVKDGVQGVANGIKSSVETVAGWFK
ncbi:T7SS effector LXG polymorphic toxin [Oceanobacillus locisalsi]|uniref:T7SS effector LXG polymorphic toxin n=1 Tax=Oceanobacillus locisalsi TaxID=546107 RepID=A0ABW3NP18_9BACI